jgi:squalene-hopene/tetraprenyl-beta-curcumene cyclase
MRLLTAAILSVTALPAAALAETPTPPPADVREAVGRSLPFLEKEGVAWMRGRQCASCHQVPWMLWSTNEARKRGFAVDADLLASRNEWAVNNALGRGTSYKLTDKSFAELKKAEMAEADLIKLQALKDKVFSIETEFRQEVGKLLPAEEAAKHQETLLKAAAIPGLGNGGSVNNMYVALVQAGVYTETKAAEKTRKELVARLVKAQQQDGSWDALLRGDVPPATPPLGKTQRRSLPEAQEATTLWTVIALAAVKDLPEDAVKAGIKAREYLKKSKPGVTIEPLLLRAMLAKVDGDEKGMKALVEDLLKLQQEDGGWSWLREGAPSDPYTTGEVLYGLSTLGRDRADPSVRKAIKYLLSTQKPDGSWFVDRNRISSTERKSKVGDEVHTYWGTAWAVVGLLKTLPPE